jgi:hypothetical protein
MIIKKSIGRSISKPLNKADFKNVNIAILLIGDQVVACPPTVYRAQQQPLGTTTVSFQQCVIGQPSIDAMDSRLSCVCGPCSPLLLQDEKHRPTVEKSSKRKRGEKLDGA